MVKFRIYFIFFFFRLNDIDRATTAKSQVENKQREEAKQRKESNDEWDTKVNYKFFIHLIF